MAVMTEILPSLASTPEQLLERRYEVSVELARLAEKWATAWYAYQPVCPWDAVNERIMATHEQATAYREKRDEYDKL